MIGLDSYLTGIDTNVLLRYLTRDDETQHAAAEQVMLTLTAQSPGFITQVTLAELYWTLTRGYKYSKKQCLGIIRRLVWSDSLEFDDGEGVVRALHLAEDGADFADALIHETMQQFGATETVTFDRAASERLGWRLLGA